ncbi:MAG: 30S ribosomal protein S20 [Oscillospiraceae bacterium]|jgi:small subunit ribosomal protein S20|nr:30S ribosomal protein S20 [Oscillospiraceae bacterium]
MPNIKSSSKRVELTRVQNARNRAKRSYLKTAIKKFENSVVTGNAEETAAAYTSAVKAVDRAAAHGLIHRNNASRKKSALTLKLNAVNK